jgi:hypothetical protein
LVETIEALETLETLWQHSKHAEGGGKDRVCAVAAADSPIPLNRNVHNVRSTRSTLAALEALDRTLETLDRSTRTLYWSTRTLFSLGLFAGTALFARSFSQNTRSFAPGTQAGSFVRTFVHSKHSINSGVWSRSARFPLFL